MIFINLLSPNLLKTLNKIDKGIMKFKLARFLATIKPTLIIWSKRGFYEKFLKVIFI